MPTFETFDGISLFFQDEGDGRAVLLLHGFAADTNLNYVRSGLLDLLLDDGHRVIALDARGHGLSAKPTEPESYAGDAMRKDVLALLEHLRLDDVVVVGYSMGAHLALRLADDPRVKALVLLGIGDRGEEDLSPDRRDALIATLESDTDDDGSDPSLSQFRVMAGLDRAPLLAYMRAQGAPTEPVESVDVPALLVVGVDDALAGDPGALAARLGAEFVSVPGDHFNANQRPELHTAVSKFVGAQ